MSGNDLTANRILAKNQSLWDEFDRQYNKIRESKPPASEACWEGCKKLEEWIRERTKKRPLGAIEIDNIYVAAKKKMHAILTQW